MGNNWIPGYLNLLCPFLLVYMVTCLGIQPVHADDGGALNNSFILSSFTYAKTALRPYEWRYIRVTLPPEFCSLSISLESDTDIDLGQAKKASVSTLPMICLREGSPPLPDVYNISQTGLVLDAISNGSFGGAEGLQIVEQCYPMQKFIALRLTNEQIAPGTWYFGLFNGIGPLRTQSKMINRGHSYSFSGNVSVEACMAPQMSGQFCNRTVDSLSCLHSYDFLKGSSDNQTLGEMADDIVRCRSTDNETCHEAEEAKVFSLNVVGIAEKLTIAASNISFSLTQSSNGENNNEIVLICYARHGAMPSNVLHDYSGNISHAPLVIPTPKIGQWYFTIQPINLSNGRIGIGKKVCYSPEWKMLQCPHGKAGPNCTWERYMLQTVLRRNPSVAFEAYYIPITEKVSPDSANFALKPLLSNLSYGGNDNVGWTFFLADIPSGAAGGNLHIRFQSDMKINYEIYARYGGFPSLGSWDYYYVNNTSSSNGSTFFKVYDSTDKSISFYILYIREGTWSFGLRHLTSVSTGSPDPTMMSISLERCPQKCSSHGTCQSLLDISGLTLYSYCACDRNHGGFDCSVELVSHQGHIWQSISLIASNAAAVLPAYWALRHKAFAEWVLYTASGISSGLYHACDVGTWCPLTFHALQFLDFWLSFMAVVSTFVYLAAIDETSKRTIHTVVAILTAIMAETGPTRSSNIALVISIGALGLIIGWLIEFCTHYRSFSCSFQLHLDMVDLWLKIRTWIINLFRVVLKRFHWGFLLAGFTALAMAAISWKLETNQTYWIWHSMWHITIYTSSFLFLCSKAKAVNCEDERPSSDGNYVLTRQNSFSGGEQRDDR